MITLLILLAEKGLLPDSIIRIGIRRLCRQRLVEASRSNQTIMEQEHSAWIDVLKESPIALVPEKAMPATPPSSDDCNEYEMKAPPPPKKSKAK